MKPSTGLKRIVTAVIFLLFVWSGRAVAQSPPTIVKSFSSATVGLNESVTLTFTITNPNPAVDLTGVAFNDNMPAGLIIANPDSLTGSCDPGVITTSATNINIVDAVILANSSCTFSIDVLATTAGDQVNTTDPVTSNEGGTGGTATASVTVVVPDLTVAVSHTGNFQRPQTGATYTITVSNPGGADTTAIINVSDALPAGLTATDISGPFWNCTLQPLGCTRGDTLFAGTSFEDITLTVNVTNSAPASVTNVVTVSGGNETNTANDSASDPTQIDAILQMTAQNPSVTVAAGSTATATLNVNYAGGLGAVTFACSGLPAAATCTFSPSSVSATGVTPVTLSIATTARSAAVVPRTSINIPPMFVALFMLLGLLALAFALLRTGTQKTRLATAAVGLALLFVAGCGGSSKPTPPLGPAGTPAGTSAVTVTASSASGGATTTSAVNLTVQ